MPSVSIIRCKVKYNISRRERAVCKHRVQHVSIHLVKQARVAISYCIFMKRKKDWFKLKKYPHIGLPLKSFDRPSVTGYVKDPDRISAHSFFPFIHRDTVVRKFRREIDSSGAKLKTRISDSKPRELYYANHLDSMVYSYYAKLLSDAYELKLTEHKLSDVVTAYRAIKIDPSDVNSINKCNADFASEIFSYILSSSSNNLVALAFDIKGFFDNLDHKSLKKQWYKLYDRTSLIEDEYNVFRNITNFSFINEKQLFNEFKDEIIVETKSGIRKNKAIKKLHYLKNNNAIAFCTVESFKERAKKLVVGNNRSDLYAKRSKGIPQGSPISAVLANVYMLPFDDTINKVVSDFGGIYRRYSDDMIVVCNKAYQGDIIKLFENEIRERDLEIQPKKTQIFEFNKVHDQFTCCQIINGIPNLHKNLEYLGFEFDGQFSYLKSSSLASFYRKMKRAVQRSLYYSKTSKAPGSLGQVFRTRLFKKYTFKGKGRRVIYKQDKMDPAVWNRTENYNWGNYLTYADLAMNKLPNNKIKGQVKRHWKILNQLIS